jgi:hypothetical protein
MRVFKVWILAAFFSLISMISSSFLRADAQEAALNAPQKEEAKSLIRLDLLRLQRTEARLPKRNIFAPRSHSSPPLSLKGQEGIGPEAAETLSGKQQERPAFNVNLRYIGYIESPGRMIALIILEGQALAVAEGEVVSEGIRIGKISPTEIEIIMPDSTNRKFSLEGE